MQDRFTDKVVVITGSNSGIGLATARRMLAEGAIVVAADRSPAKNPLIAEYPERVVSIRCDVSVPADIDALAFELRERFRHVDVLVNNAGITGAIALTHEYDLDEYERVMNTNVRGTFLM